TPTRRSSDLREAGNRSKIAVYSRDPNVDPVGACVGPRGTRVQAVVQELRGEKIDIVEWSPDPERFVANALSPAKVVQVYLNHDEKSARAVVPDHQLSLAIGKEGQKARRAARLCGWKIDVKSAAQMAQRAFEEAEAALRARRAAEAAGQAAVQEEAEQLEPAALAEATVEDAADVPVAAEIPVLDDAAVELDADLGEADAVLEDELPEE